MPGSEQATQDQFARIAPHYDRLMASVPYARWADYLSDLALLVRRPILPGAHLLDLATGTGSVALEFARRGCVVTGLDLSEPMLAEARRKADEAGLVASFLQSDLCSFSLPAEFDCATCLYDSFNYVLEPEHLEQAFANTRRSLKPGGVLLFDVNTVHALEAELFTQTSPADAAVRYRWRSKYDWAKRVSTISMHFQIRATGEEFDIVHRQRAYTDAELRSLLFRGGFGDVYAYDGYRLSPPTLTSDRVFYVALPRPA